VTSDVRRRGFGAFNSLVMCLSRVFMILNFGVGLF
jgi:hypothetical protein